MNKKDATLLCGLFKVLCNTIVRSSLLTPSILGCTFFKNQFENIEFGMTKNAPNSISFTPEV